MNFTPIIPTNLRGDVSDALLNKSELLLLESAKLVGSHSIQLLNAVENLLLKVNSYYSNKIESEGTRIADIEKAMRKEYSNDKKIKNLQMLSVAHIEVQKEIITSISMGKSMKPYSKELICAIHFSFYTKDGMDAFLDVSTEDEKVVMVPGKLRHRDVQIKDHVAPVAVEVENLVDRYEYMYGTSLKLRKSLQLIYAMASHHRLAWIHPFLDGNGRTSRLALDATLRYMGFEGYGLWNISRGLARDQKGYREALRQADLPRRGDYDGKGELTAEGLERFVDFMLNIALNQVRYMGDFLKMDSLARRMELFVQRVEDGMVPAIKGTLPAHAGKLLNHLLLHGECIRGDIKKVIDKGESTATKMTRALLDMELIASDNYKAPVRININSGMASFIFPDLVPEELD